MNQHEKHFLKDVRTHVMQVIRDEGTNRHLRFRRIGTREQQFDLITWPGHLCYTGHMGTYVFTRLEDMFEFFRPDRYQKPTENRTLFINRGYWAEKCIAADRDGIEKYSDDKFTARIKEMLDDMDASDELREAVDDEVLSHAEEGESEAIRAAIDFQHEGNEPFQDLWEVDCKEYTHRFTWCCLALAWGINQYDASKELA